VIVQTCSPFNVAIQAAVGHDCESFYGDELLVRKELGYPPFGHLIAVRFGGEEPEKILSYAGGFMDRVAPALDKATVVSEPAPAPIERVKGSYRYLAIFRGGQMAKLRERLREELLRGHRRPKGIDLQIDVDAMSISD
jgi:primosomal protein N' (replication factor Y)